MNDITYVERLNTWVPADDRFATRWKSGKGKKGKKFGCEHMANLVRDWWGDRKMRLMLDCGSFVGWCARFWSDTADNVIAWEPNPVSRRCVEKNCGSIDNIKINNEALSAYNQTGYLGFNVSHHYGNCTLKSEGFPVQLRALDSYDLQHVDFIKIDVEGAEFELLQGARQTIQRCRPVIQIEINEMCHHHGHKEEDVHDKLKQMGMTQEFNDNQWDYLYRF